MNDLTIFTILIVAGVFGSFGILAVKDSFTKFKQANPGKTFKDWILS